MSFLDPWFYALLLVLVPAYWLTPPRLRMGLLLLVWIAWLAWASPLTLAVFAGIGVFAWCGCSWISGTVDERSQQGRKWLLSGTVVVMVILVRIFWKDAFGGLAISVSPVGAEVLQLLGFAYVVLKVHHCFVIAKVEKRAPLSLFDLLHYLIYVPTLSAGPIVRMREWRAFASSEIGITPAHVETAVKRILWGLFKKTVLVTLLVEAHTNILALDVWWNMPAIAVVALFTIYFDFSGYSDIAIGVARLFGHRLPENFREPFSATSLSHFWRKWHISMGDWLREHIFIPLGGMRAKGVQLYALLFFSMMFCGLWHAFEWRFVMWGMYHGILLAGEQAFGIHPLPPNAPVWQVWPRRIMIFIIMAGSSAFFIAEFWR